MKEKLQLLIQQFHQDADQLVDLFGAIHQDNYLEKVDAFRASLPDIIMRSEILGILMNQMTTEQTDQGMLLAFRKLLMYLREFCLEEKDRAYALLAKFKVNIEALTVPWSPCRCSQRIFRQLEALKSFAQLDVIYLTRLNECMTKGDHLRRWFFHQDLMEMMKRLRVIEFLYLNFPGDFQSQQDRDLVQQFSRLLYDQMIQHLDPGSFHLLSHLGMIQMCDRLFKFGDTYLSQVGCAYMEKLIKEYKIPPSLFESRALHRLHQLNHDSCFNGIDLTRIYLHQKASISQNIYQGQQGADHSIKSFSLIWKAWLSVIYLLEDRFPVFFNYYNDHTPCTRSDRYHFMDNIGKVFKHVPKIIKKRVTFGAVSICSISNDRNNNDSSPHSIVHGPM